MLVLINTLGWIRAMDGSRKASRSEIETPGSVSQGVGFYRIDNLTSGAYRPNTTIDFSFRNKIFHREWDKCWKTTREGLERLRKADRIQSAGNTLAYVRFVNDFAAMPLKALWTDTGTGGFGDDKFYIVQTTTKIIGRCLLMATDPGDLVLDPTCGSGTTAAVAEQWGRRWITIDTSRVALALARTRVMAAKYSYYLLSDSREGRAKEAQITGKPVPDSLIQGDLRQGFVYDRAPHVTLGAIANNAEIDVLWEQAQATLDPLRVALNKALGQDWQEWQIPREAGADWPAEAKRLHEAWWQARIARQRAIDASIARKAEVGAALRPPLRGQQARPRRRTVHGGIALPTPRAAAGRHRADRRTGRRPAAPAPRSARVARPRPPILPPWCWTICAPPACTSTPKTPALPSTASPPGPAP